MRLIVDSIVAVALVAVLGVVLWHHRSEMDRYLQVEAVQQAIRAIESQALYHGAVADVPTTPVGYARRIDTAWFDHLPGNILTSDLAAPWIEHVDDKTFNPRHIVADTHHASFWYNPQRGLIRARVPAQLTEEATVELYNLVNGTSVRPEQVDFAGAAVCNGHQPAVEQAEASPSVMIDFRPARR